MADNDAKQEVDGELVDLAAPEGTPEYERAQEAVMRAGASGAEADVGVAADEDEGGDRAGAG
jgi:hypothetical protein